MSIDLWDHCTRAFGDHDLWVGVPTPSEAGWVGILRLRSSDHARIEAFHNGFSLHLGNKLSAKIYLYHALLYLEPKIRVACEYIQSTHWLATGYLIGQAWKNMSSMKSSSMTNMRARTLPSQNACRVKADGMGPSCYWRVPLRWYTQDLTIMVLLV